MLKPKMNTNVNPSATSVQIFNNSQFGEIRTIGTGNDPRFCLTDVCRVLGLKPKFVNQRLSGEVVSNNPIIDNLGRTQQALFVNEDGLYDVILDSRKPEAKQFRKWVTSEVLPEIRKNGGYIQSTPEETPEMIMARALKVADQTLQRNAERMKQLEEDIKTKDFMIQLAEGENVELKKENTKLLPKANYTESVLQSDSTYTFTQVAHDLQMRSVYVLTEYLAKKGFIYKQSGQWQPTAKIADRGYFATRTAKYFKTDGSIGTTLSTVFTERGRAWIHYTIEQEGGAK